MTEPAQFIADLSKLTDATVLCVGDVMLDRFVYGDVNRISPEAPIPVFRIGRQTEMLGGAGNVLRNLAGLGAIAHFVSVTGIDEAGRRVTDLAGALDGVTATIYVDEARQTSIKTRYIAGGQQMLRADEETVNALSDDIRARVLKSIAESVKSAGAVVLADYGKGMFTNGIAQEIITLAHEQRIPVIIDPQGNHYHLYKGADLVTPNRKELSDATQMPTEDDATIIAAAAALIDAHAFKGVLATRSGDGMTLIRGPEEYHHFPAEAREVFDVSGAGDTVVATIAAAWAAGLPLEEAAKLANVAAGIVVGKVGTAVAYASDMIDALHAQERDSHEAKISPAAPALDRAERWRQRGLKVGLTNGCFDLLHPGHLAVLNQAKAACDRLIVALNSDASTSRLKGPERPVQNEHARAAVLASLEAVDMVVIFEEDTPAKLIEAIRPDVYVKGADYRIEDIPEAKIVQGYGGEVRLAELAEGHSTTATIARINR